MIDVKNIGAVNYRDNGCITLYILDLEDENDNLFYQQISNFQLNIILMSQQDNNTSEEHPLCRQNPNTKERKIGSTTFIVSSRFKEGMKHDIVSMLARLIQNDNGRILNYCDGYGS